MKNHIKLGRLFGIPLRIDLSWLLIAVWVTWSLATSYFPDAYPGWGNPAYWLVGFLTAILFFASVLLHEVAHALVARAYGQQVSHITLFVFGGAAQISQQPATPKEELQIAAAGPLASLVLGGLFLLVARLLAPASGVVRALGTFLGGMNLSLGAFNLIPGFPLDGGRVLRALLWKSSGDLAKATRWAVRVGQVVAYGFIGWGMWQVFGGSWIDGLWMMMIGMFVNSAAKSELMRIGLTQSLEGHTVQEIMSRECATVPQQLTLDLFVEHYLVGTGRRCYLVRAGDDTIGLATLHGVQRVSRRDWGSTQVADIAVKLDDLRQVAPETPLLDALQQMTADGVNQLPVVLDGNVIGMVTREGLVTFMQQKSKLERI